MIDTEKDRSKSLWEGTTLHDYPELKENTKTEVCIVGGGINGISTAYQLAKRGHKVIVLESTKVASGQSGRTTAHLTYQVEEQLSQLVKLHTEERLTKFVQSHRQAIGLIEEIIFQENISCDFKRLDGYLFAGSEDSEKTLKEEVEIGNRLGLDLTHVESIPGVSHLGPAVLYPDQGQFHPLKYMSGLLRVMSELDVKIYEGSHVKEFKNEQGLHQIICENGSVVEAKYLVVATDSPINNRFYIHTKQAAYRTYVVGFALEKKSNIPLLWDTEDPYHYIRVSGNTLILGGEDHRTGQNPSEDPYENLKTWARENLPLAGEEKLRWSGQVFEPVDGMAYIGKNPGQEKNVFIITGLSGIGMTYSAISSLLIADLIDNRPNPLAELYNPSRTAMRDKTEFIKDNSNVAFQYKDWITPSDVKSERDIPVDHGGVIREGIVKNAVYHADGENFEKKCAVCPHLGGIVQWNNFEKTWDCPCHGSRFNTHGKVIEGPSISGLQER